MRLCDNPSCYCNMHCVPQGSVAIVANNLKHSLTTKCMPMTLRCRLLRYRPITTIEQLKVVHTGVIN